MNQLHSSRNPNRTALAAQFVLACVTLLCAASAFAQSGAMSPYQGEKDGVSAGGKWMEFREDPNYPPRVDLFCENGKLRLADFNPGVRLPPPNRPGFWGQPQLEVMVRIDETHGYHGWNWERGHFLSMDKGTTRGLLGAQVFNIELPTASGRQIAEFSPAGLNREEVGKACDLTPKKPSKD